MPETPKPISKTAVVIITYESGDCVQKLLRGLDSACNDGLTVYWFDNGSSTAFLTAYDSLLAATPPSYKVKKIWRAENLGYASAVNLALGHVTESYTLLVNPDVEVTGAWVAHVRAMLEKTGAQIGTSQAVLPDGARDLNLAPFPGLTKNLVGSTFVPKSINRVVRYYPDFSCIMMKTDFLKRYLPLRQFFLYGEDVEFMQRVRCENPLVVYDTSVTYLHDRSTSSAQNRASAHKACRIVYADALLACEKASASYRLAFIATAIAGSFLRVLISPRNKKKRFFAKEWTLQVGRIISARIYREDMHVD